MMLNTILEEMGRVEERTNKHFDNIESKLDSMQHEINACKLERESIGGHVRKGAKSEIVAFWKIQPIEEEKEDSTKEVKQISLLRYEIRVLSCVGLWS